MPSVRVTTVAVTMSVATLLAAGFDPAAAPPSIDLRLEQVKEVRRLDVKPPPAGAMTSMFDEAGLTLRFGLSLPPGRQVIRIEQPESVRAVGSEGTDLSAIAKNVFGRQKFAELIHEWDKPPHALEFKLALPKRSAATFSLTTRLEAVTCRETAPVMIEPTTRATTVPDLLADAEVSVRIDAQPGSQNLVFKPGTVRDVIEKVELKSGAEFVASQGSMWNDQEVTYMFPGGAAAPVRLTVRRGLERVPISIDLREQKLP
ncbi:MAG: hypothetical protein GY715_14940 [Planctomycetes bacterium]|nr:hypothetical protein [Planctomycetota bacterium]